MNSIESAPNPTSIELTVNIDHEKKPDNITTVKTEIFQESEKQPDPNVIPDSKSDSKNAKAEPVLLNTNSIKRKNSRKKFDGKEIKREICTIDQLFTAINEGVNSLCIHACNEGHEKKDYDLWIMGELLKKTRKLESFEINLDNAETTNEGCKSIGSVIKDQISLSSFKLSYHGANKITDEGLEYILQGLAGKELENLNLCFCDAECSITDNGAKSIANVIAQCPSLTELNLNFGDGQNKITDDGVRALCESIAKLNWLETLELLFYHGENEVTDNGLEYISFCVQKLQNLKNFALDFYEGNNKITDIGCKYLHVALKDKTNLKKIEIHVKGVVKVSEQSKKKLRMDIKKIIQNVISISCKSLSHKLQYGCCL